MRGHGHGRVVHGVLSRIAPALERLNDARIMEASVNIPGDGNLPEHVGPFARLSFLKAM